MNREKMHKLALFLEDLDKDRFSIGYWVSQSDVFDGEVEFTEGETLDINLCGTAGCIAGWAVALENNGKIATMDCYYDEHEESYNFCAHCNECHYENLCPEGYVTVDLGEVEKIARNALGLDAKQAERLFIPDQFSVWEEYAEDYGLEPGNVSVFHSDIHPKHAADMLYRILNGEVVL